MSLIISEQDGKIEITFWDHTIETSTVYRMHQSVVNTVRTHTFRAKEALSTHFNEKVVDFDTLCGSGLPFFFECIANVPKVGLEALKSFGISDVEENTIAEFLSGDLDWCISNVESLFEQIYNQINDYTLQKYNTRIEIPSFGWKGYGVGIKGAVKAELQAQVLNFGSAMAVSLGRALMNRAYEQDLKRMRDSIFYERDLCSKLLKEFFGYINHLESYVTAELRSRNKLPPLITISEDEYRKIITTASSLSREYRDAPRKYATKKEAALAACLECIKANPAEAYNYINLRMLCGNSKENRNDVVELAEYFGCKSKYEMILSNLLNDPFNRVCFMKETSHEDKRAKLMEFHKLREQFPELDEYPNFDLQEQINILYSSIQAQEKKASSSANQTNSSGCFITSAVCQSLKKPDDCYELETFRAFRDSWLRLQPGGEALVQEYYQVAPQIVDAIDAHVDSSIIYQEIWSKFLTPCLRHIENKEYDNCKILYSEMVNTLKGKYM